VTLLPGSTLGPYQILAQLGAGGMGEVYRASDARLGREVAIKVLPPAFADDPDRLGRFEQEARSAGSLNHPNVLSVYDVGTHLGSPYLVMELLEGKNLREELRGRLLPPARAAELASAIAKGLGAAHEKGLVHRDLKPENIFLTGDGRVKILDFGLAKPCAVHPAEAVTLGVPVAAPTQAGMIMGTVGYMSPEQVKCAPLDGRSDLFALGIVLQEMLTGQNPFRRNSAAETISAVLTEEPGPMPASGPFSRGLSAILGRCLAKAPELRFQSARELASALDAWAASPAQAAAGPDADHSIVVLPFDNLSPDPDNAYFADGLTEEIIADLARIRALRVISRKSALHYRNTALSLPEVAAELRVRHVLVGSVRRAGNSLRITAQLLEAAGERTLWSEKFSGTLDDVFDMQEKVSRAIVEALQVHLSPGEHARLADRPLPNPAAYESYLRAYQDVFQWDPEALKRAGRHLDNARAIVGDHPLVLAGYSALHYQTVNLGLAQDNTVQLARSYAERALALDPALPQGHTAMALVSMLEGNYPKCFTHFKRARQEAPGDISAWGWMPWSLMCLGLQDAAAPLLAEVLRLDPVDPNWHLLNAALRVFGGNFGEGARLAGKALAMAPGLTIYRFWHARALALAGQVPGALTFLEAFPPDPGQDIWVRLAHLLRRALRGDAAGFDALLSPEAVASLRRDGEYSFHMASMTAGLGRPEEALDWLEHAVDRTFIPVALYLAEPALATLSHLQRFQRILDRARRLQPEYTPDSAGMAASRA